MAWRENEDEVNPQKRKDGERHREKDGRRPRLPQSEPRTHQRLETNNEITSRTTLTEPHRRVRGLRKIIESGMALTAVGNAMQRRG